MRNLAIAACSVLFACSSSSSDEGASSSSHAAASSSAASSSASTGSGGAGGDGGAGGAAFFPATHEAAPQVVSLGGKVLTSPKVVAITWEDDPNAKDVEKFVDQLAASSVWSTLAGEYGVGKLTALPPLHIPGSPPANADESAALMPLDQNTQGASPPWGAPDPETIYLFFIPEGVTFSFGGFQCCGEIGGSHDEVVLEGGVGVPYAYVCQCGASDGVTALQATTTVATHEILETATDPYSLSTWAYVEEDKDHAAWTVLTDGELGDMCALNMDQSYQPPDMDFMIQRTWSNMAASAGHDPCVPHASPKPYFNSVPRLDDAISIDVFGQTVKTKGVKIPVGGDKTIEVDLFSDAPLDEEWTVVAHDPAEYFGGTPHLHFTWDKTKGKNGDKLALTIHVDAADAQNGAELFFLESKLDGADNIWVGAVGQ